MDQFDNNNNRSSSSSSSNRNRNGNTNGTTSEHIPSYGLSQIFIPRKSPKRFTRYSSTFNDNHYDLENNNNSIMINNNNNNSSSFFSSNPPPSFPPSFPPPEVPPKDPSRDFVPHTSLPNNLFIDNNSNSNGKKNLYQKPSSSSSYSTNRYPVRYHGNQNINNNNDNNNDNWSQRRLNNCYSQTNFNILQSNQAYNGSIDTNNEENYNDNTNYGDDNYHLPTTSSLGQHINPSQINLNWNFQSSNNSNNHHHNDDNNNNYTSNNQQKQPHKNHNFKKHAKKAGHKFAEYLRFVGPGFLIAVSYMDPGNYSTNIQAGSQFQFALLFAVLFSNFIAVYLQSLAIKLGTVSGRDLAQVARDELPRWVNVVLYVLAEIAIVATDISNVVGAAVALNILVTRIPLPVCVLLTIVPDMVFVLVTARGGGGGGGDKTGGTKGNSRMMMMRYLEYGLGVLVLGVSVCFAIQLSKIPQMGTTAVVGGGGGGKHDAATVLRGFLPSKVVFRGDAMYAACGILGSTVMPHGLYVGSSLVKPRLVARDIKTGRFVMGSGSSSNSNRQYDAYRPSLDAIQYSLKVSIIELSVSLFTFALFVNAAIQIIAGCTLYGTADSADADLYSIYEVLGEMLSKGAAVLFMISLFLSGQSAGIICTIAGQVVSEGYFDWNVRPLLRRVVMRVIALVPCLAVSVSIGRNGMSKALNATQVVLSILLPFLVLPLIYFTSKESVMTIKVKNSNSRQQQQQLEEQGNGLTTTTGADDFDFDRNLNTTLGGSTFVSEEKNGLPRSLIITTNCEGEDDDDNDDNNNGTTNFLSNNNDDGKNNNKNSNKTEKTIEPKIRMSSTLRSYEEEENGEASSSSCQTVSYKNGWFTTILGSAIWLFITVLNVYLIVQLGLGKS